MRKRGPPNPRPEPKPRPKSPPFDVRLGRIRPKPPPWPEPPPPKDTTDGRVPPFRGSPHRALKPPRGPFNLVVDSCERPARCRLCRRKPKRGVGETLAVGPWSICEECVKVLDEVLGA